MIKAHYVKTGDCYEITYDSKKYLLDGGGDKKAIASKLTSGCSKIVFNAVICTHFDADHANGIAGIINNSKITIQELWVPENVTGIARLLGNKELLDIFLDEIKNGTIEDDYLKENLEGIIEGVLPEFKTDKFLTYDGKNIKDILQGVQRNSSHEFFKYLNNFSLSIVNNQPENDKFNRPEDYVGKFLFSEPLALALSNVALIWKLLETALSKSIEVRAFKFVNKPCNISVKGHEEWFPHNSEEKKCIYPVSPEWIALANKIFKSSLFCYLAAYSSIAGPRLNKTNKEALTWWLKISEQENIFFCSDSDLGYFKNGNTPVLRLPDETLITAPHHGSPSSDKAYEVLDTDKTKIPKKYTWVRSDGLAQGKPYYPSSEYLHQRDAAGCRACYCTSCRDLRGNKKNNPQPQDVTLEWDSWSQSWHAVNMLCSCRK